MYRSTGVSIIRTLKKVCVEKGSSALMREFVHSNEVFGEFQFFNSGLVDPLPVVVVVEVVVDGQFAI